MIQGDVNKDGLVTQLDFKLLTRAVAGIVNLPKDSLVAADLDKSGGKPTVNDLLLLMELLEKSIPGDTNGDGIIDKNDVITIQKHIAGIIHLEGKLLENADVNGDHEVNIQDATMLQKLIKGIVDGYIVEHTKPKHNKIVLQLESFQKGEYLSWFVTTQAAYEVTVTLKDDNKTYFSAKKQSTNIEPPLAVGNDRYAGNNLRLEISVPQSNDIKPLPSMHTMISDTGKVLGHSFTCCGEDWIDNDYNDFYINIVGWKSKY